MLVQYPRAPLTRLDTDCNEVYMPSLSEEVFIDRLQAVPTADVEEFCARLWAAFGWEPKRLHADEPAAIDLTVKQTQPVEVTGALYFARTDSTAAVGADRVFECLEMRQVLDRIDLHVLITNDEFSTEAWALGREQNIKLVDGAELYELSVKAQLLDSLP